MLGEPPGDLLPPWERRGCKVTSERAREPHLSARQLDELSAGEGPLGDQASDVGVHLWAERFQQIESGRIAVARVLVRPSEAWIETYSEQREAAFEFGKRVQVVQHRRDRRRCKAGRPA